MIYVFYRHVILLTWIYLSALIISGSYYNKDCKLRGKQQYRINTIVSTTWPRRKQTGSNLLTCTTTTCVPTEKSCVLVWVAAARISEREQKRATQRRPCKVEVSFLSLGWANMGSLTGLSAAQTHAHTLPLWPQCWGFAHTMVSLMASQPAGLSAIQLILVAEVSPQHMEL